MRPPVCPHVPSCAPCSEAERLEEQQSAVDTQAAFATRGNNNILSLINDKHSTVIVINATGVIQVCVYVVGGGEVERGGGEPSGLS